MYTVYTYCLVFLAFLPVFWGQASLRTDNRTTSAVSWLLLVADDSFVNFLPLNEPSWDAKLANRHPASLRSYMEYKCGPTATGAPFVVNGNIRTEYMCTYFSCDVNLETRGSPKNNRYLNPYRLLTLFTDVFVCP